MAYYDESQNEVILSKAIQHDFVGVERTANSTDSWSSGFNTPSSSNNGFPAADFEQPPATLQGDFYVNPETEDAPTTTVMPWGLPGQVQHGVATMTSMPSLSRMDNLDQYSSNEVHMDDMIFHVLVRTPERLFRREIAADAFQQHQLDSQRKSDALRYMLTTNTDLLLRDSIGDTILHTLAGDFGQPDLFTETEGYDILRLFFDIGNDGFGPLVKSCCLSMINSQNDGYSFTNEGIMGPFMHTPLGVAILYNNIECARLLLQNGADPNIPGEWGKPPLFFAQRNRSDEAIRLLIESGAFVEP